MSATPGNVISPVLHHVNLKTTQLQAMVDWYMAVVGSKVTFQFPAGAWLTNDAANHRIALLAIPGYADDPNKDRHTGLHHTAFEYQSFSDLMNSYRRYRQCGRGRVEDRSRRPHDRKRPRVRTRTMSKPRGSLEVQSAHPHDTACPCRKVSRLRLRLRRYIANPCRLAACRMCNDPQRGGRAGPARIDAAMS
jgi:Glyoxalase/Bleomycin resistance protein/Dioxygenase superfamily